MKCVSRINANSSEAVIVVMGSTEKINLNLSNNNYYGRFINVKGRRIMQCIRIWADLRNYSLVHSQCLIFAPCKHIHRHTKWTAFTTITPTLSLSTYFQWIQPFSIIQLMYCHTWVAFQTFFVGHEYSCIFHILATFGEQRNQFWSFHLLKASNVQSDVRNR